MRHFSASIILDLRLVLCVSLALSMQGCAMPSPSPSDGPRTVSIMTFNVENLFDTVDDPGKNDRTYLPLASKQTPEHRAACADIEREYWRDQCLNWDWSEETVQRKLRAIADAILQVGDGRGPDIVALQEVENIRILERLRTEYLQPAGYRPAILLEGGDARGIDVAFLARLESVGEPSLHLIPFEGFSAARLADTRPILEATFRLPGGALLTGFSVHFPSPYHPWEMRRQAYEFLERLRSGLPQDRYAFAAGDFNTPTREDREQSMLDRFVRPVWQPAHEMGCEDCRGTYYYRPEDEWSYLDMILWSPGAGTAWRLRRGSARIANRTAAQVTSEGYPRRFRMPEATGSSDHWPLVVEIETVD